MNESHVVAVTCHTYFDVFFLQISIVFFCSDSGGTDVENNLLKDNFKWNMLNKKPRGVFEGYIKGGIKGFIIFELLACAGAYAFYHRCNTNRGEDIFLSVMMTIFIVLKVI